MYYFLFAEEFLRRLTESRIVHFAGGYGSGKTSLAVICSHWLVSTGRAKVVIGTVPVAWGTPCRLAPPMDVVVILDEGGVFLDNRGASGPGAAKQNEVTRKFVAFLRKLNTYVLVPSRVAPDVRFRSLAVQRIFAVGPLEVFQFGIADGNQTDTGRFAIWGRSWLWDRRHPAPLYSTAYVPSGYGPVQAWLNRTVEAVQGAVEEDPNDAGTCGPILGLEPGARGIQSGRYTVGDVSGEGEAGSVVGRSAGVAEHPNSGGFTLGF